MATGNAGRRYAQAIFDLAKADDKLEQWSGDLQAIAGAFEQAEVKNYLENPKTSRAERVDFVKKVLGGQVSQPALNLSIILVQRQRQAAIMDVNAEFAKMWNRLQGIESATVTTATEVNEQEAEAIRAQLAKVTGKQITVRFEVDPAIIGGLIARVGDTLIDGSIRSRLQNLRKQLAS